jgi:hypothetical protein
MIVSSLTYTITTYIKSYSNNCYEVIELNKKYVSDFVVISNMIREERMKGLKTVVDTVSVPVEEDTTIIPTPEVNVMDSILSITESNTKE